MPSQGLKNGHVPLEARAGALRFIIELRETLGLREEMLPVYLEEITCTLSSHALQAVAGQPSPQNWRPA